MNLKNLTYLFFALVLTNTSLFSQNEVAKQSEEINAEFEENDGIAVVEIESVNPGTGWRGETLISGFTGTSYIRRSGSDNFNAPGKGLTEYKIKINNPGVYHFRWHSKIMHGSDATESNDSWLRIPDAADFFAKNGNSIKYPNGGMFVQSDVVTNGSSSDGWMKTYSSGTVAWTWSCRTSDNDAHEIYATFDTVGVYTVQISGRSKNHALDRFVMFKDSLYTINEATDLTLEETMIIDFADLRSTLAVNYGSGSGSFQVSSTVEINADKAPTNKIFDQWIGDTENIEDVYEETTTIFITNSDAVLTASYMDESTSNVEAKASEIKIYPNPASESFYINIPTMQNPVISIYSLAGKQVYETKAKTGTFQLFDHGLSTGTYVVQIRGNNQVFSELIHIQ